MIAAQPAANRDSAARRGQIVEAEIRQQGSVVARVLAAASQRDLSVLLDRPRVLLTGRGSSGAAALYGAAALTLFAGRNASEISPSLLGFYRPDLDLSDAVLLAISQSGSSREVMEAASWARSRGAKVVALTNRIDSPLTEGMAAELVLPLEAGDERAVPATKTFTASIAWLMALAVAPHLKPFYRVPSLMESLLARDYSEVVRGLQGRSSFCFVGEGVAASVAREGALKFREMLGVATLSLETSDLLHGSIGGLGRQSAVVGMAADKIGAAVLVQAKAAWEARGARGFCIVADHEPMTDCMAVPLALAPAFPLLAVLPLQLLACNLALQAGYDPDRPSGLSKVTHTRVPQET
jgi:glutamine---fructose-6-phosphate transaminase (isomerizing)